MGLRKMNLTRFGSKHKRPQPAVKHSTYSGVILFGLAGCGGGSDQGDDDPLSSYVPPAANYEPPVSVYANFNVLEVELASLIGPRRCLWMMLKVRLSRCWSDIRA